MHERIKKLLKQATKEVDPHDRVWVFSKVDQAKFAELIVRECVGVVEGGSFLHDQAPTAIFARECSSAIKRHFGVEE
jgi:hypothetical protein